MSEITRVKISDEVGRNTAQEFCEGKENVLMNSIRKSV
jgi:hypothetical protein